MDLYRSDGAHRREVAAASWGAVHFGNGPHVLPISVAYGCLGPDMTVNVAEYVGFIACLRQALQLEAHDVCFQVDSMLVARQATCEWACRAQHLKEYFAVAFGLLQTLRTRGGRVIVEHIYREYNTLADSFANHALETQSSRSWHEYNHGG